MGNTGQMICCKFSSFTVLFYCEICFLGLTTPTGKKMLVAFRIS